MLSRGVAWLLAALVLVPFAAWQAARGADAVAPLPVLHTLGGDFTLDSTLGRAVSLADFRGAVVVLNFGYTGCPDVCPTALARLRDALNLSGTTGRPVVPLFVTLDPAADTVERMTPYVGFFHPDLIGLTGSEGAVAIAAEPFKVFYQREPDPTSGATRISHSSHLYLIDTAGRVRATFAEGVPVAEIAGAIRRLREETESEAST